MDKVFAREPARNDEILATLKRIEQASTATAAKIGSAFWGAGVLPAAGMNYGRDGGDSIVWSLPGRANVGYLMVKHAAWRRPGTHTPRTRAA